MTLRIFYAALESCLRASNNPGGDGHAAPGSFGGAYGGYTSAQPRIIPERGEIWFTDQDRGFYVVRFAR